MIGEQINKKIDDAYDSAASFIDDIKLKYNESTKEIILDTDIENFDDFKNFSFSFADFQQKISSNEDIEKLTFIQTANNLTTTYTIQKGDTVWGICNQLGLTYDELIALNSWLADRFSDDKTYALIKTDEKLTLPVNEMLLSNEKILKAVDEFNKANTVVQLSDPLLVDLDGDGVISTTTVENGIYFDHENDGFMETSAWVDENDGVLAIDKNNNGIIDNGTEIFGDNYVKTNGSFAKDGFDALKDLDSNNDGVIDSNDEQFSNIKILKGDGALLTLDEAGVVSINLRNSFVNKTDENGNTIISTSTYTKADGTTGQLSDYTLQVDKPNSFAVEWLDETEDVSSLPEVMGSGTMHSLHQTILRDESGELKQLLESYLNEESASNRKNLVTNLIYKWTGVENIDSSSRGTNIDAKKLTALEKFMGEKFIGVDKSNNPNNQAANILEAAFTSLVNNIYATIESQTTLKPLYDLITIEFNEETNEYSYNLNAIQEYIDNAISENSSSGKELLKEVGATLLGLGLKEVSNYSDFYNHFASIDSEYKLILDTADKVSIQGTDQADELEGTANGEVIYAGAGDDVIYSRQGDDIVYGGDGDANILNIDFEYYGLDVLSL